MRSLKVNGFVLISVLSCINAINIPSTITNSTGEYFIVSQYGSNFTDNNIKCTQTNCLIYCDSPKGCDNVKVDSSLSSSLTIDCSETRSCQYLSVTDEPSDEARINCYGIFSCYYASFTLTTTPNIDVTCTAKYDYITNGQWQNPCYYSEFDVSYSDIAIFQMNPYSSRYTIIYADNVQTLVNITASGIMFTCCCVSL